MRDWKGDLEWYATHQTTEEIGFNPDRQCLRVCRTSREIEPVHPTAKAAQDATPKKFRVTKVRDLRKGMKLFFDDPNDSNTAGHVVTMIGRVKGFDENDLNDVLVETNSVLFGQLVVVRATYFKQFWNDDFQFGAAYLNNHELDVFVRPADVPEPEVPKTTETRVRNFKNSRPNWDVKILDRAIADGRRDLTGRVNRIDAAVDNLPDDDEDSRVKEFKDHYATNRELRLRLLNEAVNEGRTGTVKSVRDDLRQIIKSFPDY